MIKSNKIESIIICDNYTVAEMMKNELGMEYSIGVELYNVSIGDTFDNGRFYNSDGTEIFRRLTDNERLNLLEKENINLKKKKESLEQTVLELITKVAKLKEGGK